MSAFDPGCDLWIAANCEVSRLARKIDWYLNFQVMKSEVHQPIALSDEIKKIHEQWPMPVEHFEHEKTSSLMVASERLLPNVNTVFIPLTNPIDWITQCFRACEDLRFPKTRIFLPDSMQPDVFEKQWAKLAKKNSEVPQLISGSTAVS